MSMDRTDNPFTPPKASVADVVEQAGETQLPPLWSAKGRIGRLRYLCYLSSGYLLFAVLARMLLGVASSVQQDGLGASVPGAAALIAFLVFCVFTGIKRSHDMDWSGWTVLLSFIVPFAGFIWIFKSGTQGPNRFGAPPAPNTTGIRIGALVFPAFFTIGILAAIALPAYSGYQKRAKARQDGGYSQPHEQPAPSGQAGPSSQ